MPLAVNKRMRLWSCVGDDGEAGAREGGFRVSVLQLGSARHHLGGEGVAWAIDVSRGGCEVVEGWVRRGWMSVVRGSERTHGWVVRGQG